MNEAFVVETTRDDSASVPLRALESDHSRWKLIRKFDSGGDVTVNEARTAAHRAALSLRDAGRHTTGINPVVRVRRFGGETETIMQRLRYRERGRHD